MKRPAALLLSLSLLTHCHKASIDPAREVEATIVDFQLNPAVFCQCCQGYRVRIGTNLYFTNQIAAPYDQPNTAVWIRYKQPEDECASSQATDRITILSIRGR